MQQQKLDQHESCQSAEIAAQDVQAQQNLQTQRPYNLNSCERNPNQTHEQLMTAALSLAERARGSTSPNPLVGCVLTNADGAIIGRGYHQYIGGPHAEINALQSASDTTRGAIAYVTLEPCAHYGRTPPCVNALIHAGIAKVYVATLDPNPLVSGRGVATLRNAGIEVEVGLCEEQAKKQNEIFFHYMIHKTPFLFAKWAMSLDGKTITHHNDSREISGLGAAQLTHRLRREIDAIIIGANTACYDDPQLTARPLIIDDVPVKQPLRVIVSSSGNLPAHLRILAADLPGQTLIATTYPHAKSLLPEHVEVLILPANQQGQVDLLHLLKALGEREITSALVEGGMTLHESFMSENLIQKIFVYVAPVIIGNLTQKRNVEIIQNTQLMHDSIYEVKYV